MKPSAPCEVQVHGPLVAFLQVGCLLWQMVHCCRPKRWRQSGLFPSAQTPPQTQSESMHICLSWNFCQCLSATWDAHTQQLHGMSHSALRCAVGCSRSDGDLRMTPARLQQIVDGSQQDELMAPQAKQSLSHPASHPLHMTTASREQSVTMCTLQHYTSLLQAWWPDPLAVVHQPKPANHQVCTQAVTWSRKHY
jgi:hypothetical protein